MLISSSSFFSLLILITAAAPSWKAIDLSNGRVSEWNPANAPPTPIERIRLRITKTSTISSPDKELLVHIVRIRWTPPHMWNDKDSERRNYHVFCELERKGIEETTTVIDMSISADFAGIDERFNFPSGLLAMLCAVRPINGDGIEGNWSYSQQIYIDNVAPLSEAKANFEQEPLKETKVVSSHVSDVDAPDLMTSSSEPTTTMSIEELRRLIKESTIEEIPFDNETFAKNRKPPIIVTATTGESMKSVQIMAENSTSTSEEAPEEPRTFTTTGDADDKPLAVEIENTTAYITPETSTSDLTTSTQDAPDESTTSPREDKRMAEFEEKDIFFSAPRFSWEGLSTESEEFPEPRPLTAQEMVDYENLENELKEALGVNETKEAEILLSSLGRVI